MKNTATYYNVHSSEQQYAMHHGQYEHSYQHQHDCDESNFIFEVTVARL